MKKGSEDGHLLYLALVDCFVFLTLAVPVATIPLTNKNKTLSRLPYFWRLLGVWAVGLVLSLVFYEFRDRTSDQTGVVVGIIVYLGSVTLGVFETLWSVHRIQDIGQSKWWTLFLLVPVVNLIYVAVMIFCPGQEARERSPQDAAMV